MLVARRALVCAPVLLMAGCSGLLSVSVTGDGDTPIFHVTGMDGGRTEVRYLSVSRLHPGHDSKQMWGFSSTRTRTLEIHARYGKTPKGFVDDMPARPLERNVEYYAQSAGGPKVGSTSFWLDDQGRVTPR